MALNGQTMNPGGALSPLERIKAVLALAAGHGGGGGGLHEHVGHLGGGGLREHVGSLGGGHLPPPLRVHAAGLPGVHENMGAAGLPGVHEGMGAIAPNPLEALVAAFGSLHPEGAGALEGPVHSYQSPIHGFGANGPITYPIKKPPTGPMSLAHAASAY